MNQPLAYVHPQAKVAKNTVIEPFVNIEKNVEIGEGTWIGSNVTIMEGARIGKNCKIFPGAVIAAVPQDLKFNNEDTIVRIGDNTVIREFVTINRGTKASYETVVGNNCLLMAYVHVAHDCYVGNNVILANAATLAGHITVDDWAIIGGLSAVHQFVNVGAHVMISGWIAGAERCSSFYQGSQGTTLLCGYQLNRLTPAGDILQKRSVKFRIFTGIFI
jgi:UDP-N-acetylglucosamine acyltransferase